MDCKLTNGELIQVWLHHNELRWRVLLSSPIFCGAVLAGWYAVETTSSISAFSNLILVLGMVGTFAYYVLLRRLGDYAAAFHEAIQERPLVRPPFLRLPAFLIGLMIPVLLGAIFAVLLFAELPSQLPTMVPQGVQATEG